MKPDNMQNDNNQKNLLNIARKAAEKSNCRRRRVGCVIAFDKTILIESNNGTPDGIQSCKDGGCDRCLSGIPSGESYESCLCMHAEQAAIAQAAKMGKQISGATLYCTLRPCLNCLEICYSAGIKTIVFDDYIKFRPELEEAYSFFVNQTKFELIKILFYYGLNDS